MTEEGLQHPIADGALVALGLAVNSAHNDYLVRTGRKVAWWKRHPVLTYGLFIASFVLAIDAFGSAPSWVPVAIGYGIGWGIPVLVLVLGIRAYIRAERRWNSPTSKALTRR